MTFDDRDGVLRLLSPLVARGRRLAPACARAMDSYDVPRYLVQGPEGSHQPVCHTLKKLHDGSCSHLVRVRIRVRVRVSS